MVVVAEAGTVRDAIAEAEARHPDVVVMDVRLTDGSGVEATREIRSRSPKTHVLMLTSFADDEAMFASIAAGASGYVLKTAAPDEVVEAVRRVGRGELVFPPSVAKAVLEELREDLTPGLRVVVGDEELIAREGLVHVLDDAGFTDITLYGDFDRSPFGPSSPEIVVLAR